MLSEYIIFGGFVFVIGLCIGSFLNVVILRGFSGESIVFPPSKCPKCQKKLNWYTNIPLISYIFLGGKCQFCKKPISIQYPLVELANGLLYLSMFLKFGIGLKTLFLCVLSSLFVLLATSDLKERVIFDVHTYIMVALGLLYNILHLGSITIMESVLGVLAGFLVFEIMAKFGTLVVGARTFGEGDTLIAMGLGAFFGWRELLFIIFFSMLLQAVLAFPMLVLKYFQRREFKSAIALTLLVPFVVGLKFAQNNAILTIIICSLLMACLVVILKELKNRKEQMDFYYLPFGPALVVCALISIFSPFGAIF